jgi:3-oxosteroid 1-dehydrogenase
MPTTIDGICKILHVRGKRPYNGIAWNQGKQRAVRNGRILQGVTIAELAAKIHAHPDNRALMDAVTLTHHVETWNRYCTAGHDADCHAEPETMGAVCTTPYFAIHLYPGGPHTKGGLRAHARRAVLDWDDTPIPRLYAAAEICSVFQFVYQGGGNLAECLVVGRITGMNAAADAPLDLAQDPARP